jgi:hypothetical protein
VEVFGVVTVGVGCNIGGDPPLESDYLRWRIGPGVRFWARQRLGMSLAAGVWGDQWKHVDGDEGSGASSTHGIFAQIAVLGVL